MILRHNREGTFNRLLQEELHAVAEYESARARLGQDDPQAPVLSRIQQEHRTAAEWLRRRTSSVDPVRTTPMSLVRTALAALVWIVALCFGILLALVTVASGGILLGVALFVGALFCIGAWPLLAWGVAGLQEGV